METVFAKKTAAVRGDKERKFDNSETGSKENGKKRYFRNDRNEVEELSSDCFVVSWI